MLKPGTLLYTLILFVWLSALWLGILFCLFVCYMVFYFFRSRNQDEVGQIVEVVSLCTI